LAAVVAACGAVRAPSAPVYAPLPAPERDAEALRSERLPADVTPLSYALELNLVPSAKTYSGRVTIELALDRPRESLYLHARGMQASEVRVVRPDAEVLTGTLEAVGDSGLVAVRLAQPLAAGPVRLEIAFEKPYTPGLKGLYRVDVADDAYLFTQFEAVAARDAFPCLDEPRFKTPFEVTLRVPEQLVAIANTRETSSKAIEGGLKEVRFAKTEKLPTYLVALAVGPFDVVEAPPVPASAERKSALPLRGIATRGRGADLAYALQETPAMLQALERYFGIAYPYDKLDLIAVPDFAAGAMENPGAITYRDVLLLVKEGAPESQRRSFAYVHAHELAHQWFGNLVTMPWWDDIWLNEAFATWMGGRAIEELYPAYKADLSALTYAHYAMDVDSRTSARQIRQPIESDDDIENAFDAITYSKGGAVLSMFERYVGRDVFRDGLRLYMKRHRFGNATAYDLIAALSEVAQRPLEAAFFSFLEQPGVPLLEVRLDCTGPTPALKLAQTRYAALGTPRGEPQTWRIPLCVRYGADDSTGERCTLLEDPETTLPLEGTACPTWLMPNAGAQGYYRFTLADDQLTALIAAAPTALTTRERMSLSVNLLSALRAGAVPGDRAYAALEKLGQGAERHVLESVLGAFGFAKRVLVDEAHEPALREVVRRLVAPRFQKLGLFAPEGGEADGELKLLRALVVQSMALTVKDPKVRADLARLGQAELGMLDDARLARLPPELLDVALQVALQDVGAKAFDAALAQLAASADGLVRGRLLRALSEVRDPALSERALGLSLDPQLRVNERLVPLQGQLAHVETETRAFAWLEQHLDALLKVVSEHRANDVLHSLQGFCSMESAASVRRLFEPRVSTMLGGPRELKLSLEAIESCAAVKSAQRESTLAYFAQASSGK
jgi:alanyl aminopeptidase